MPEKRITISAKQRNALYDVLITVLHEFSDIELALTHVEDLKQEDVDRCREIAPRITNALRLIDTDLGWEFETRESVELTIPPRDLRKMLSEFQSYAEGLHQGGWPEFRENREELEDFALARDTCADVIRQLQEQAKAAE